MTPPNPAVARRLVALAGRAPSVHNTQPWTWHVVDDCHFELLADRRRQLPVNDPDGRNLTISCGAALHHLLVAAAALGIEAGPTVTPDAGRRDLLARVALSAGVPAADSADLLHSIEHRCTDRRRFTAWPVPDERLAYLAEAAAGWGADVVPVTDVALRFRTELLVSRAMSAQRHDEALLAEQRQWVTAGRLDGIPPTSAIPPPSARGPEPPNRYVDDVAAADPRSLIEGSDGLLAVCTQGDGVADWMGAGMALSALWLRATQAGLSIVPLSQVIEVAETREGLRHDVLGDPARPQILVRVGWQEISRASLPRTPRRPVDEVLVR